MLLKTMLSEWQNWEALGKHAHAANVSGNMFPRFGKALLFKGIAEDHRQNKQPDKFIFNGLTK